MNNTNNVEVLKREVEKAWRCKAAFVESVPVKEELYGYRLFDGEVSVFALEGCKEAERCYAWGYFEGGSDKYIRIATASEGAPFDSPQAAVHSRVVEDLNPTQLSTNDRR